MVNSDGRHRAQQTVHSVVNRTARFASRAARRVARVADGLQSSEPLADQSPIHEEPATSAPESMAVEANDADAPAIASLELSLDQFRTKYQDGALTLEKWPEASIDAATMARPSGDPTSEPYHEAVLANWSDVTGRDLYDATVDESFEIDQSYYLARPFPYSSNDPEQVAQYLGTVAELLRRLGSAPPARVVEFGSGWGHFALAAAATGYSVTAVDINPPTVSLLRRRARALGVSIDVVESDFLAFVPPADTDAIVFFEAFHHCARPFDLLDRCVAALRQGGRLLFAADAIYDHFWAPWGIRLDGSAAIMMAQEGWLELGFERAFFEAQLHARSMTTTWQVLDHLGPYGTFLEATKQ